MPSMSMSPELAGRLVTPAPDHAPDIRGLVQRSADALASAWSSPSLADAARGEAFYGSKDFTRALSELATDAPTDLPEPVTVTPRFLFTAEPLGFDNSRILFVSEGANPAGGVSYQLGVVREALSKSVPWEIVDLEFFSEAWHFWRLAFWIIDNPDLMEKRPRDVRSKAECRQRNKSRPDRPRLVTIVDLRAAHREAAADVARAEGTYRSRWIVRRHWHNYWVGSGEDRRLEPRVVMPYVKGPAGAPLNVTERVKKW